MPPKKKKGGKKKKKKDDGELTLDDKYKKTLEEMEVLKDHLAVRKEFTRRSQAQSEEMKERMLETEDTLLETHETQKAVSADMTRQYKTMQTEMGLKIYQLETDLTRARIEIETKDELLKNLTKEKETMEKDKDDEINELRMKIETMGHTYEHFLDNAFEKLMERVEGAKDQWEDKSTSIQSRNKQTLLEFGLKPLDL